MAFVYGVLATGLAIAAWRTNIRVDRWVFAAGALLNILGIVKLLVTGDPYTWKLRPNPCNDGPHYDAAACADLG
jgi:hypothetical protein